MLPPSAAPSARPFFGRLAGGLLLSWVAAFALFLFGFAPLQRQSLRNKWQERLSSVAADRARLVATLIESIEGDARLVGRFPTVVTLLRAPKPDPSARAHVVDVLETVAEVHGYIAVAVLDSRGVDLALTPRDSPLPPAALPAGSGEDQSRLMIEGASEPEPLLSVVVPVIGAGQTTRGFVRIVVDPGRHLFPLLINEAFPTTTGETILAAIDNERVLPLSPRSRNCARRSSTPPLDLAPLLSPSTGGLETYKEYEDRSERSVLAATRPVSGTGWAVVSSVDLREALEPHRQRLAETAFWLTALLGAATAVIVGAWRSRKRIAEASATRWASYLAALLELTSDAVLILQADGRILGANARAERLYGWSREELLARSIADLEASPLPSMTAGLVRTDAQSNGVFVRTHRTRHGALFVAEITARTVPTDEGTVVVQIVRDTSENGRIERQHLSAIPAPEGETA